MKQRFNAIRSQIWSTDNDKQKLALYEEAIVIADRYLTESDAYDIRMDYSSAASGAGAYDKLFVSFAWCWAKFQHSPEKYSRHSIMWHFKWVVGNIWKLTPFSLAQIDALFELFKEKCLEYNFSLRPYYQNRVSYLKFSGRAEEAELSYQQWKKAEQDYLSDCRACEQNGMGKYHFEKQHFKRGLQVVKPILEGKMSCHSVPQTTYQLIMHPLLMIGEHDKAIMYANKAYSSMKGSLYVEEYGTFIQLFTLTNMPKATRLYNKTIQYALDSHNAWEKLHYFVGARFYLEQKAAKSKRKRREQEGDITVAWLNEEINNIVGQFNRRNNHPVVAQYVDKLIEQQRLLVRNFQKQQ